MCQVWNPCNKEGETLLYFQNNQHFWGKWLPSCRCCMLNVSIRMIGQPWENEECDAVLWLRAGLVPRTAETAGSICWPLLGQLCMKPWWHLQQDLFALLAPPLRSYVTLDKEPWNWNSHLQGGHVCMLSHFSRVPLFATPWAASHQAPLSMEFPRQEYWSVLPFLSPEESSPPCISYVSCSGRRCFFFFNHWHHLGSPINRVGRPRNRVRQRP